MRCGFANVRQNIRRLSSYALLTPCCGIPLVRDSAIRSLASGSGGICAQAYEALRRCLKIRCAGPVHLGYRNSRIWLQGHSKGRAYLHPPIRTARSRSPDDYRSPWKRRHRSRIIFRTVFSEPDPTGSRARRKLRSSATKALKDGAPSSSEWLGFPSDQAVLVGGSAPSTTGLETSEDGAASAPSPGRSYHAHLIDKEHLPCAAGVNQSSCSAAVQAPTPDR
jgi:hypothetical protein